MVGWCSMGTWLMTHEKWKGTFHFEWANLLAVLSRRLCHSLSGPETKDCRFCCKLSTGCLAVSEMFWMVLIDIYHLSSLSLSLSLSLLLLIIVNCHYIGRLIAWTLDFLTGGWNHQIQPDRYPLSSSVSTFRVSWSPRLLSHSWHWLGA